MGVVSSSDNVAPTVGGGGGSGSGANSETESSAQDTGNTDSNINGLTNSLDYFLKFNISSKQVRSMTMELDG